MEYIRKMPQNNAKIISGIVILAGIHVVCDDNVVFSKENTKNKRDM